MNMLKKNLLIYYISIFLLILARSMPHSILTILLYEKGLDISGITFIQSFFSLAILIFEMPSGVWADKYSRKFLYLLSNVFIVITFIFIYKFSSVYLLAVAWFIYGLSDATISGTLDAQIINDIKNEEPNILNKFIKKGQQISFLAMILGSLMGAFLYFEIGVKIYILGSVFVLISFFMILLFFKNNQVIGNEKLKINLHISQVLMEFKNSEVLRIFIILSVVSQIYFQTHFQLWQALFLNKGVKKEYLYIYYVLFQFIGLISYYFPIDKMKEKVRYVFYTLFILMIIPLFLITNNKYLFIVIYLIFCSIFTILNYFITYNFSKIVSQENISSLISFKSTITRVFSMLMLLIFSCVLKYIKIEYMIIFNFSLVIVILMYLIFKVRDKIFN